MLRRLFGLVVLLLVVAAAFYLWKARPIGDRSLGTSAREFGNDARELGAQARDKLGVMGHKIEDAAVTGSVKTALGLNRTLRPYGIEVSSQDGIVTLRGQVPGEGLRSRAEAVAAEVPDVVRVLNEIHVAPGGPPAPAERGSPGEGLAEHAGCDGRRARGRRPACPALQLERRPVRARGAAGRRAALAPGPRGHAGGEGPGRHARPRGSGRSVGQPRRGAPGDSVIGEASQECARL